MDIFGKDGPQLYFDEETGDPLDLWLGKHELVVDGIIVHLENVPLLRNAANGAVYFPDKTRAVIEHLVEEARSAGEPGVSLVPNQGRPVKRYDHFARKLSFEYSAIDYEHIPGLMRPQNDGFLTPVFFNLSVVNKYAQHPGYRLDLFSETYGSIYKEDEWHIAFGINKSKKVIMWLGDIDGLPESECYYLRSENIASDHDIHSEFYAAQIDAQFAKRSRQSQALHLRSELDASVRGAFGFKLYILEGEVSNVISNLTRPVFWEAKHVGPAVEALNRIFVESINVSALKDDIKKADSGADTKSLKSMKLLSAWLRTRLSMSDVDNVLSPFFVLYDFRVITSHLVSDESSKNTLRTINSRLGIAEDNIEFEIIYDALIDRLADSYETIGQQVASFGEHEDQ